MSETLRSPSQQVHQELAHSHGRQRDVVRWTGASLSMARNWAADKARDDGGQEEVRVQALLLSHGKCRDGWRDNAGGLVDESVKTGSWLNQNIGPTRCGRSWHEQLGNPDIYKQSRAGEQGRIHASLAFTWGRRCPVWGDARSIVVVESDSGMARMRCSGRRRAEGLICTLHVGLKFTGRRGRGSSTALE